MFIVIAHISLPFFVDAQMCLTDSPACLVTAQVYLVCLGLPNWQVFFVDAQV